jgi:cholesterol oxidase
MVTMSRSSLAKTGKEIADGSFDYDVLIIGSGFGGSVAALRAVEKDYRVGIRTAGATARIIG